MNERPAMAEQLFTDRERVQILLGLGHPKCDELAGELEKALPTEDTPSKPEPTRYEATFPAALPWTFAAGVALFIAQWWLPVWVGWLTSLLFLIAALTAWSWRRASVLADELNRQQDELQARDRLRVATEKTRAEFASRKSEVERLRTQAAELEWKTNAYRLAAQRRILQKKVAAVEERERVIRAQHHSAAPVPEASCPCHPCQRSRASAIRAKRA